MRRKQSCSRGLSGAKEDDYALSPLLSGMAMRSPTIARVDSISSQLSFASLQSDKYIPYRLQHEHELEKLLSSRSSFELIEPTSTVRTGPPVRSASSCLMVD